MLKSMTAYGRASVTNALGRFTAEIQSVNRKYLEINMFLPKELQRFENEIRKIVSAEIVRGQIVVKLFAHFDRVSPITVSPNIPLAKQVKNAWEQIAQELQLSQEISLDILAAQENLLDYNEEMENEEEYRSVVLEAIKQALKQFLQMRLQEGKALQEDITKRLAKLQDCIGQIEKKAPTATERYRQKLLERINELVPGMTENEERVLREVCVYADKIDITEEITRFNSHLNQCSTLINSSATHVGKTFEFLLQEMGREVNTIGSKSSDIDAAKYVIEMKTELERIREQIQNIE